MMPRPWFESAAARWWIAALLVAIGALPLFAALPTPLVDWPNHVARVHILSEMLSGHDQFWGRFYQTGSFLVPNAALDVVILALHTLGVDLQVAALIFVLLAYAAFVGGVAALAAAWGTFDLTKLVLAALLFTTGTLYFGLVNYVLAIGLTLCWLAAFVVCSGSLWRRLLVAVAGTAMVFFCHLIAAVVFVALLACVEAAELLARRRLTWRSGLATLAALVVLVGLRHASPAGAEPVTDLVYMGAGSWRAMAAYKASLLLRPWLGGGWWTDLAEAAAFAVALGLAVLLRARLAMAPLLCVAGLLGMVLLAPERIGTGSLLDYRLALLPLLVAVCAVRLDWRRLASRGGVWRGGAVAALGLLLALHSAALARHWSAAGALFRDYAALALTMPPGSVVLMANATPPAALDWYDSWEHPIGSIETSAVPHGVFVPMIFANPAQQPLAIRPAFVDLIQPVDLSSPAAMELARLRLRPLCPAADPLRQFARVYVTVLHPQDWLRRAAGPAVLLADRPEFLLLDGCALASPPPLPAPVPVSVDPMQRSPAEAG